MRELTIEQWDDTGSLVTESRGKIDVLDTIVDALLTNQQHTVTVEMSDDQHGHLLLAARGQSALVGWSDRLHGRNFQLVTEGGHREDLEMYIGGQKTHVDGADLVSLADAELAVREFLASGRGSLGLHWVER